MGKITRKSDTEEIPRLKRKRRKKDLDHMYSRILKAKQIHSRILTARQKLDNIGKNDSKRTQKNQGPAKISSRLLPRSFPGIYRNGTKGKDIRKTEKSENTFLKARLEGDALKLFNSDTSESKCIEEDRAYDKIIEQLPNKELVENSLEWTPCTLEQSPVLGKRQDQTQKLRLVKRKGEENIFEKILDSDKVKTQDINKKSKYVIQKEDICKRRLFQNDREQLENNNTRMKIFDSIELQKKNRVNKKKKEQICSENGKNTSWDPISRYMELCARISAENFEVGFLKSNSDPLTTTIKKLRQVYADSYRQQFLRDKNKQRLLNTKLSTLSVENQACTYSENSQMSPVEFEVSKCNENHTVATHLREDASQKSDKFHSNLIQSNEFKKNGGITQYSSTSSSLQNVSFATYNISRIITENRENSEQYAKQSSSNHQPSKSSNFYFVNERSSAHLDSRKNLNRVDHLSQNNRHKEYVDNFSIDIPSYVNSRHVKKMKQLGTTIFSNDSILSAKKHLSRDYLHEKLPTKFVNYKSTAMSDDCASNDVLRKCDDRTMNNMKNVKRVPTILRRCNNIVINRNNNHVQINGDYTEDLHKKSETNLFGGKPYNNIAKESYDVEFPNMCRNFPATNIVDMPLDRSKMLEPQIELMKIKDSQESQLELCDIDQCSEKSDKKNEFCLFDNVLHSQTFDISHNKNSEYVQKLTRQQHVAANARKRIFRSSNNHPISYSQSISSSNADAEPTKQCFRQIKLQNDSSCQYKCDTNNAKQDFFAINTYDQSQSNLFKNTEGRSMPKTILNCSQNIRTDKRSGISTCRKMFNEIDVEYVKNHTNRNTCHLHEETVQAIPEPEIIRDAKGYNNNTDNCVNLNGGMRDVQLSLEQKHNPYTYPKVIDDHKRTVLLQNVTQPVKYLAVKNGPNIQRIPVYVNDGSIEITESVPLKVVTLMDATVQTEAFPQEVTAHVIPLQTNDLRFDSLAIYRKSNQLFTKYLDSTNAVLFNPNLHSNTSYSSNV